MADEKVRCAAPPANNQSSEVGIDEWWWHPSSPVPSSADVPIVLVADRVRTTVTVDDDAVDSAQDTEDFTLTYSVSTSDAVYASKAGNLTVLVRVQDDDTAGIVLDGGPAGAAEHLKDACNRK
mgnify:CR=1 FL=1